MRFSAEFIPGIAFGLVINGEGKTAYLFLFCSCLSVSWQGGGQ